LIHIKKVSDFCQIPIAQEAVICEAVGHDMKPTTTPSPDFTRLSCIIFSPSPFGRMYLCADGTTSSERTHAAVHWLSQAPVIIRENWIVNTPAPAQVEIISTV
jgi:hypothetical protein